MAWHSDARSLERQGIPREFTTKSRVVIISNDWKTLNKNVAALQDRGHVLLFQPSAAEVHQQAGRWFDDQEIYQWFAANLHRVREPSLRHYVRARELKAAGMDWTEVLAAEAENPRARLAAELLASAAYGSTAARVKAFVEQGGGCRATFFNYRRYLLQKITAVMWPSWLCGLQPIDAQDPALSRSGTPHNHLLTDSKRLVVAGARGVATTNMDAGVDRQIPAKSWANPRSRWLSQRPFRERRTRACYASVGPWNPMLMWRSAGVPFRRNRRLLRSTPHNWLGHITAASSEGTVTVTNPARDTATRRS